MKSDDIETVEDAVGDEIFHDFATKNQTIDDENDLHDEQMFVDEKRSKWKTFIFNVLVKRVKTLFWEKFEHLRIECNRSSHK